MSYANINLLLANCTYNRSGIHPVPNKLPKHIAPTGKKEVVLSAKQEQTVTIACAKSATGHHIPPYFIFAKRKINLLLIKGSPTGCDMGVTDKGCMIIPTLMKWLAHFEKFANPPQERPISLILDNHVSHINLEVINHTQSCRIHLLSLAPHSSQNTQPLDRIFLKPFKTFYDETADDWTAFHPGQTLSIYHVEERAAKTFQKTVTVEKADLEQNDDPVDLDDVVFIVFNNNKTHLSNKVPANVKDAATEIFPRRDLKSVLLTSTPKKERLGQLEKQKQSVGYNKMSKTLFQCAKPTLDKRKLQRKRNSYSSESDCGSLMSIDNTCSELSLIFSEDEDLAASKEVKPETLPLQRCMVLRKVTVLGDMRRRFYLQIRKGTGFASLSRRLRPYSFQTQKRRRI
ncbi:hypothetical protein ILUMI_00702 [Ignelater luminosus]|uniref:DDE-1 domain-containing protein n=1 Tax=Ignelater luminosus TaxID=2038154 RepID=A0A8K0DGQ3_IGNLU|nr:hypothetical protein ILUMI_00702 [Ignelater luminosus]